MKRLLPVVLLFAAAATLNAAEYQLTSPDGKVQARFVSDEGTAYSLSYDGQALIVDSPVSMTLSDGTLWGASRVRKVTRKSVNEPIKATFYRKAVVDNAYNELNLDYGIYNLVFRAYDDGFAY